MISLEFPEYQIPGSLSEGAGDFIITCYTKDFNDFSDLNDLVGCGKIRDNFLILLIRLPIFLKLSKSEYFYTIF